MRHIITKTAINKDNMEQKIVISKDGPYIVSGGIPLSEKIITPVHNHYVLTDGKVLPQKTVYALCRCGSSLSAPFCDGIHVKTGFDGSETASRQNFNDRIQEKIEGKLVDLLDDGRCAFARFCHREKGDAWTLAENAACEADKHEAITAAYECPSGRLVVLEKDGAEIEPPHTPSIEIWQDPEEGVSGPIVVKGYIKIVSSDGFEYERRNRVALCRCGGSHNKPFCDAIHVGIKYSDR
ncbi:MAG: CDGSH iron-sulfur domain-containing protein [Clostridia bacterium]|nr:CDGSH iron-sulfur domain-containing protein [Clostridia bacterium]